jgi:hypothetical protein
MKYAMPTFYTGCAIASQKYHISLYIYRVDLVEKYREKLGELKVGKSCIQLKKMDQLPETQSDGYLMKSLKSKRAYKTANP